MDAPACEPWFHFGVNDPVRTRSTFKNHGLPLKNV
jgi:hypothetical protein